MDKSEYVLLLAEITLEEPAHTGSIHGRKDVDDPLPEHVMPQKVLVKHCLY